MSHTDQPSPPPFFPFVSPPPSGAGAAGAAAPSAGAPSTGAASAASAGFASSTVGGSTVTSGCAGSPTEVTPSGNWRSERCTASWIASAETSISMNSGISVGRHSTSTSRMIGWRMPPSTTPRGHAARAEEAARDGDGEALGQAHLEKVDVQDVVGHRVALDLAQKDRLVVEVGVLAS